MATRLKPTQAKATAEPKAPTARGDVIVRVSLHWGEGRTHWDGSGQLPCRICKRATNLRDAGGAAVHKTCLEGDIESLVLQYARALIENMQAPAAERQLRVVS